MSDAATLETLPQTMETSAPLGTDQGSTSRTVTLDGVMDFVENVMMLWVWRALSLIFCGGKRSTKEQRELLQHQLLILHETEIREDRRKRERTRWELKNYDARTRRGHART